MNILKKGNCIELIKELSDNSIDLVVTSPPYDEIRNYNNTLSWNFDKFKQIASELYRVVKKGGVIIWVVGDQTKNGSETGTSFKQALYFKEIGFNLYDTMIYRKLNYMPLTHRRYEQEFEYMFCLTKGKPNTFNPIKIPCKYAGTETWGKSSFYKTDNDNLTQINKKIINNTKIKGNIFEYRTGSTQTKKIRHPAVFPLNLAKDQIISWTNECDVILDPFMGSGTTGVACTELKRNFIGFEIVDKYFEIAKERISECEEENKYEQLEF